MKIIIKTTCILAVSFLLTACGDKEPETLNDKASQLLQDTKQAIQK